MLYTHPGTTAVDTYVLVVGMNACFECSQLCSACVDALLGDEEVSHMRRCITM